MFRRLTMIFLVLATGWITILCWTADGSMPLAVITGTPRGSVQGQSENFEIVVGFNQPMVPLEGLPEGNGTGPLVINPPLPGKYRWRGTNVLVFTPGKTLTLASTYTVKVPAGTASLSGSVLLQDEIWTFETLRPALTDSHPYQRSAFVELNHNVELYFNQPMDPQRAKGIEIRAKKDLGFTDHISYSLRSLPNRPNAFLLALNEKLPIESVIEVEVPQGLLAAVGTLGTAESRVFTFQTYNRFRFLGAGVPGNYDPDDGFDLSFSNPVDDQELRKNLQIMPEVKWGDSYISEGSNNASEVTMHVRVSLQPETTYTLTISKDLKDQFGQVLGKPEIRTIRSGAYQPTWHMPTGQGILESYLEPRIPITAMNWDTVHRRVALLSREEVVEVLNQSMTPHFQIDEEWHYELKRNVVKRLPMNLKSILGKNAFGFVYIDVDQLPERGQEYENHKRHDQAFFQVTNLGITGKYSPDNHVFWVTRLKDGIPVANADIELRSGSNQVIFQGKTNKNGICETPGWEALVLKANSRYENINRDYRNHNEDEGEDGGYDSYGNRPGLWVFAKKDADQALLAGHWGMGINPYEFGIPYTASPSLMQYQGHIFTERGLYRPNETVYIKGVFREKRRGEWNVPSEKKLQLIIKNSRNEEIANADLELSAWGGMEYQIKLPAKAPTGFYSVEAQQSNGGNTYGDFRVEAYKPAKFEVKAAALQSEYFSGQDFTGKIQGHYLFGAPMSKDKASWALRLSPYHYTPPNYDGYTFGGEDWWNSYSDQGRLLSSQAGTLDEMGEMKVSAKLDLSGLRSSAALTLEGTVTSVDNQSQSGRTQAIVHRGEYYIGIKQNRSFLKVKEPLELDLVAVGPNGGSMPGQILNGKIIKREWISVRKAGSNGRYEWESEVKQKDVDSFNFTTTRGPVKHRFTPSEPGFYIMEVMSQDRLGNPLYASGHFYVSGPGYVGWERRNDDRIDLVSDQTHYRPGDHARIMIKNPYESAMALVTLEREYILGRMVLEVKGSTPVIEFPIGENYLPNVYVCVTLVKGRMKDQRYSEAGDDLSKPSFKMGYLNLGVDPGSKRLAVKLKTDQAVYPPKGQVEVEVQVKNAEGHGIVSEVTLAVVDKGVLNLIDYPTPDSFNVFYGSRPLSVASAESRAHVIGQRNYGEKGENRGGGGGLSGDFRGEFLTTPYYKGRLYTDSAGKGKIHFNLPDNLTTFKIMATVQSRTKFGSGETLFKVSKPLMLLEALPRFLRVGDVFSGGVTLHNLTQTAQTAVVVASVEGLSLTGASQQKVTVLPNEAQDIRFQYQVPALGEGTFKFLVQAPVGRDGLMIRLPILMPKLMETVATYNQTIGLVEEAIKIPEKIFPEIGQVEFTASSTALVGLEGNLDYLIKYPYGCLEQKMSRILPLILAEKIINDFKLTALCGKDLRGMVQGVLDEAPEYQHEDGGFAFWKDSHYSCPYLTAYALYVLHQAKAGGYTFDKTMAERAAEYLKVMQGQGSWNWPYSLNIRNTTLAYMQYVLSLWGQADVSILHRLYDEREKLSVYGLAMLMRALHKEENPAQAEPASPPARTSWFEKITRAIRDSSKQAGTASNQTPATPNQTPPAGPHTPQNNMEQELERMLMNKLKTAPTMAHFEEDEDDSGGWIFQSNVRTTAVILSTLLETKGEVDFSEKIIKWLMEKRRNGHWQSTQNNVFVFEALNDYYRRYESEKPEFTATILLENQKILEAMFQGRTLDVRRTILPVSQVPHGRVLPVKISKQGQGRLYYGLRFSYAPLAPVKERDEGISVSKRILNMTGGEEAKVFRVGETYVVALQVHTLQERNFVVVDDPLPAGFEVVNTTFVTENQELLKKMESNQSSGDGLSRWWGTFNHFETYDDRVLLFADDLRTGNHTYRYFVRATTPGVFYLPNTKSEEMYTPEVFGWCQDRMVEILPAKKE